MTRINLVPVQELSDKHLLGENHEITRVFGLVRKAQTRKKNRYNLNIPKEYVLGTGHVTFFYDKLGFILERYHQLNEEMIARGFNSNAIDDDVLCEGIHQSWFRGYEPTEDALAINRQRIKEMS